MVWLKRLVFFVLIAAVMLLALAFMAANETLISMNFFLWEHSGNTGVWMIAAFAMGVLITLIATYPVIVAYKFRISRVQKKQLDIQLSEAQSKSVGG